MKRIPNLITLFRILLLPVFYYTFWHFEDKRVAFLVFTIASISDLIDGYLARKFNAVSDFGKLMDPLADKLMQVSAIVCLAVAKLMPWPAAIIIGIKETLMLIGGIYALKGLNIVVYSNKFGKFASFFFSLMLCLCFFTNIWFTSDRAKLVLHIFVYISVAFSVLAMVQYGIINIIKPYKEKRLKQ